MLEFLIPYLVFQYIILGCLMMLSSNRGNRYLGIYFFLLSLRAALVLNISFFSPSTYPIQFYAVSFIALLSSVISLYCYFNSFFTHKLKRQKTLFLLPFFSTSLFIVLCQQEKFVDIGALEQSKLFFIFTLFHFVCMLVFCLHMIVKMNHILKQSEIQLSPQKIVLLYWSRFYLAIQLLLFGGQNIILIFFHLNLFIEEFETILFVLNIYLQIIIPIATLLALCIAYFVLRNPKVFEINSNSTEEPLQLFNRIENKLVQVALPEIAKLNIGYNRISEEQFSFIVGQIEELFTKDQIFLNPTLTIKEFSDRINCSVNNCSFVINQHWKMNFKDLVNEFRVEHAKKILLKTKIEEIKNYTIAMDSGFNSESSFYLVFKKKTGQTPIVFRQTNSLNTKLY